MASYNPPKQAAAWVGYVGLPSVADGNIFQSNPTLATGDVKVSIDGGALADITTLPDVDPNNSKAVKVSLSAAEMTGLNIQVIFSDASGSEWKDVIMNIQGSLNQFDDIAAAIAALNNLSSATVAGLLTATVADSVPADGTRPSIASGILMICRFLMEASVAGTTVTVKKEDGSTTSMTFTTNDASAPTAITRAT